MKYIECGNIADYFYPFMYDEISLLCDKFQDDRISYKFGIVDPPRGYYWKNGIEVSEKEKLPDNLQTVIFEFTTYDEWKDDNFTLLRKLCAKEKKTELEEIKNISFYKTPFFNDLYKIMSENIKNIKSENDLLKYGINNENDDSYYYINNVNDDKYNSDFVYKTITNLNEEIVNNDNFISSYETTVKIYKIQITVIVSEIKEKSDILTELFNNFLK